MKLDRNTNPDGRGKYALVLMRKLAELERGNDYSSTSAVGALSEKGVLQFGDSPETEFFVIKLKDRFAPAALTAYGLAAIDFDPEFAGEVLALARKALENHGRHLPD